MLAIDSGSGESNVTTHYKPRYHQKLLHLSLKRFNVLCCHRRFGKTVFCINEVIDKALNCTERNPQFAYIAPNQTAARRIAWLYFKDHLRDIPNVTKNEANLSITIYRPYINGGDKVTIMLLGAEKHDNLRGIYLDGCVMDEAGEMKPEAWTQTIRPALSDRKGWCIFIGTPKGHNFFYKLYKVAKRDDMPDWQSFMFKASETKIIDEKELRAAELTMGEDDYAQEFECNFDASLSGSYYGKYMANARRDGRICSVPYDPAVPVDIAMDLGISDSTTIVFAQQVGREIHIIDYLEDSGQGLEFYVKAIQAKDYLYRDIFLPHDANARELGTGKTRIETLRKLGLKGLVLLPKMNIDDGIHAVRQMLPKCWFDEVKTDGLLEALKHYQKKWDSKAQVFHAKPLHDWASHGADGFRYLSMGYRDESVRTSIAHLPKYAEMDYDIFGDRSYHGDQSTGGFI